MWPKYILIFILFYVFAVLQTSFLVHFAFFGSVPNLIFIFLFTLLFFEKKAGCYEIIFYAISAGLFLDLFSNTFFGLSIALAVVMAFLIKKTQGLLQEQSNDKFPFGYFLPLFIVSLLVYGIFARLFENNFKINQIFTGINIGSISGLVYNLLAATAIYFIYREIFSTGFEDRQLNLFKK